MDNNKTGIVVLPAARLLNLTTGVVHTKIDDIYNDIEAITGFRPLTHELPKVLDLLKPWFSNKCSIGSEYFEEKYFENASGLFDIHMLETNSFVANYFKRSVEKIFLSERENKVPIDGLDSVFYKADLEQGLIYFYTGEVEVDCWSFEDDPELSVNSFAKVYRLGMSHVKK